jgi:hypothetical protein
MNSRSASILTLALLAALPASAARVYVPVVAGADGTVNGTEITLSNRGNRVAAYKAMITSPEADEGWLDSVPADRAVEFTPAREGLLKLDLAEGVSLDAWLKTELATGSSQYSRLPAIDEFTQFAAGSTAYLQALERDRTAIQTDFAVVNPSAAAATCTVQATRADDTEIGDRATFTVAADSERRFADALGTLAETTVAGATFAVSCDTAFYPYATVRRGPNQLVSVVAPILYPNAPVPEPCPTEVDQFYCYQAVGAFHRPAKGNERKVFRIPVAAALRSRALLASVDVFVGPWNKRLPSGAHSPLWINRGKYRGNTVGNFNFFGGKKNLLKFFQNINLPAGKKTIGAGGFAFQQGHTYRLSYSYLPQSNKTARLQLSENGVVVKTLEVATTTGQFLDVALPGLQAEFGHHKGLHPPEVEFPEGWVLSNFKLVLFKP